ncbi:LTA synthase family protein [Bacillus gobiensis]|uniref:LTA synthase family protein n=1 Tax=Bacillus gobiensis TaxID=1441095 RepID=UPI003D191C40
MKTFLQRNGLRLFAAATILLWIKTYAAYLIEFKLGISNVIQVILLFINPLSSSLFFLGFALLFKRRGRKIALICIHFLMSSLLYANIVYYRFFNDFITVPTLMQAKVNGGQLGDSVFSLMSPFDIFYFADTILLIILAMKLRKANEKAEKKPFKVIMAASIVVFLLNLGAAEIDRPELLSRTFDRNYLVKYLGAYNFTVYDIIQNTKSNSQRVFANSNDITEVENYMKATYDEPNPDYFGKAKGMNVIYISLESLQDFIINYKIDGKEVTPFLNSLVNEDSETLYFDHFYHQTGQGKTSDAEFMMDNSLYPLSQGSVFVNNAQNTYQSAPAILKQDGYTSAAFHGNYKTFWNRNEMFKAIGYDKFFDADYYDMSEGKTKNYGMKDKPFFKESMPLLTGLKQPFYSKFITLSNHFPFQMDSGDTEFPAGNFDDAVVDNYFQSAHYMDEAIEQFFTDLKKSGLYDNTVIVMYGDHYGISENHNKALEKVTGKEMTDYNNADMQQVPLFIHVPGIEGKTVSKYSGDVDVAPTLLHLLGKDTKNYLMSGSDILSKEHREVIPFRNGDFVSPEYYKIDGNCYAAPSGEPAVDSTKCENYSEQAKKELEVSDQIVNSDLLRFYNPPGFKKINPADYDYTHPDKKNEEQQTKK